jgi:hypothetical protein
MAIVAHPKHDVDLKQVEAFRGSIIAFNQRQTNTKVQMGGTYVDRIVLSKRFFAIDFLEHDRVFWEKFHEREEQASDFWRCGSGLPNILRPCLGPSTDPACIVSRCGSGFRAPTWVCNLTLKLEHFLARQTKHNVFSVILACHINGNATNSNTLHPSKKMQRTLPHDH